MFKRIGIVTPCYNEEANVRNLRSAVLEVFNSLSGYAYEHIFIDNASQDKTVSILRTIAHEDPRVPDYLKLTHLTSDRNAV
ncbi:MAG: glycosyltransferase [Deltaproteobacteria bacterium]|nr:glycosyltransferase [Deltaproteobacteria bacterium]